ncbi:hypothetical protein AAG570_002561 [Ranatra chinensis]|uniref:Hemocyanin middle domain-containing protein n=1 Tax=Ranatra chinensis TaxID=642074 RepID=A0ABD0Y7X7_9HEMI
MGKTTAPAIAILFFIVVHGTSGFSQRFFEHNNDVSKNDFDEQFEKEWNTAVKNNNYKDPEAVKKLYKYLWEGQLPGPNDTFNMRDSHIRETTIALMDALIGMNSLESMGYTTLALMVKNNGEQAMFATVTLGFLANYTRRRDMADHPPYSNVFSQYFIPKDILTRIKSSLKDGTYSPDDPDLIVAPSSAEGTAYFREDAGLSSMYAINDIIMSRWVDPRRYDQVADWSKWSEAMFEYYDLLVSAYKMREEDDWQFDWKGDIQLGHETKLTNMAGRPMASRSPEHPAVENKYYKELMDIDEKIMEIYNNKAVYINDSYSFPLLEHRDMIVTILTDILFNTTSSISPTHYKSYFDAAVDYIASIDSDPAEDAGGVVNYTMSALRDPAFYSVLNNVIEVIKVFKREHSPPYTKEELILEDVVAGEMSVTRMETSFEKRKMFVGGIVDDFMEWMRYQVQALRLTLEPFTMKFQANNKADSSRMAIVTVMLVKDTNPDAFFKSYQPLDRFPVERKNPKYTLD